MHCDGSMDRRKLFYYFVIVLHVIPHSTNSLLLDEYNTTQYLPPFDQKHLLTPNHCPVLTVIIVHNQRLIVRSINDGALFLALLCSHDLFPRRNYRHYPRPVCILVRYDIHV